MKPKNIEIFQNNLKIPTLLNQNIESPTTENTPSQLKENKFRKDVEKFDLNLDHSDFMEEEIPVEEDNIY